MCDRGSVKTFTVAENYERLKKELRVYKKGEMLYTPKLYTQTSSKGVQSTNE